MTAYYNEIDPYAAQWLRNLIKAGHIAPGDVDERSVVDVRADDLKGYTQAHFFAGIGGWSIALRLAGWPDDRPVWTGSCPCQPFSAAGAGKAADDERHLWPAWFPLIAKCGPPIVFGEQVEAAVGWGWFDVVFADLEGEGYACGATVLPACSVGAPHIRQRLWFVADSQCGAAERRGHDLEAAPDRTQGEAWERQRLRNDARTGGEPSALGDANEPGSQGRGIEFGERAGERPDGSASPLVELADAAGGGFGEQRNETQPRGRRYVDCGGVLNGFWRAAEWIACTDGKARPVGPGSFPLGHGIQHRPSKLRAYGNAIVPQVAAEFIVAACG